MDLADEPMPGALYACATKRKRSPCIDDEDPGGSYVDQRQTVLNMSMVKLRISGTQHRRTEPSLRRSVLIFNTLKHIETELREEGVAMHPVYSSPPAQLMAPKPAEVALDPHPEGLDAGASMDCNSRVLSRSGSEESTGAAATPAPHIMCVDDSPTSDVPLSTPNNCHSTSSSALLGETRSLLDSVFNTNFPTLLDSAGESRLTASSVHSSNTNPTVQAVSAMTASACISNAACSSSSALSVTNSQTTNYTMDTDWLHDLDLTWLDFDLFTPLTSMVSTNGNSAKLPSLNPDDVGPSLSACSSNEVDPLGSLPTPSCNPKHDLLSEDLDRVMEILVGM